MEPTNHLEQAESSIHETGQECCDTECSVVVSEPEISTNQNAIDSSGAREPVYTSRWLKENTKIHGWLIFFLLAPILWPIVCLLLCFTEFCNNDDLHGIGGGIVVLALFLVFLSKAWPRILFIVIAIAFYFRKKSAVFYAQFTWLYVGTLSILSILWRLVIDSEAELVQFLFLDIVPSVIWLNYFKFSKQVNTIIPRPFRKFPRLKTIIVMVLISIVSALPLALICM